MKLRLAKPAREAIGMRLRELRRFHRLEQTELAQMAGLSQAIISQYEKGMTELSLAFITFLTDRFQISTEWLISGTPTSLPHVEPGRASADRRGVSAENAEGKKTARFLQVPIVAPHVAAQPGAVRDGTIGGWQPVPAPQLSGRTDLVAVDIKASWVKNMAPPFRPTSRAIIDRDDKEIHSNCYYAVNGEPGKKPSITAIRRLNLSGDRLWLLEDKPSGSFESIDLSSRFPLEHAVIGRLVWICQQL